MSHSVVTRDAAQVARPSRQKIVCSELVAILTTLCLTDAGRQEVSYPLHAINLL